ncbi:unnamed protein product [Owenia fusiformis]|uniref:Uncharacterized protein n=1 Tax=Owenia fusiformis TaxID=6347 RepID=A0A8J1UPW2_OWEFU|nr:unnamed protein product [Owenia fusiformis]
MEKYAASGNTKTAYRLLMRTPFDHVYYLVADDASTIRLRESSKIVPVIGDGSGWSFESEDGTAGFRIRNIRFDLYLDTELRLVNPERRRIFLSKKMECRTSQIWAWEPGRDKARLENQSLPPGDGVLEGERISGAHLKIGKPIKGVYVTKKPKIDMMKFYQKWTKDEFKYSPDDLEKGDVPSEDHTCIYESIIVN